MNGKIETEDEAFCNCAPQALMWKPYDSDDDKPAQDATAVTAAERKRGLLVRNTALTHVGRPLLIGWVC